jgi:hypothetical protein
VADSKPQDIGRHERSDIFRVIICQRPASVSNCFGNSIVIICHLLVSASSSLHPTGLSLPSSRSMARRQNVHICFHWLLQMKSRGSQRRMDIIITPETELVHRQTRTETQTSLEIKAESSNCAASGRPPKPLRVPPARQIREPRQGHGDDSQRISARSNRVPMSVLMSSGHARIVVGRIDRTGVELSRAVKVEDVAAPKDEQIGRPFVGMDVAALMQRLALLNNATEANRWSISTCTIHTDSSASVHELLHKSKICNCFWPTSTIVVVADPTRTSRTTSDCEQIRIRLRIRSNLSKSNCGCSVEHFSCRQSIGSSSKQRDRRQ